MGSVKTTFDLGVHAKAVVAFVVGLVVFVGGLLSDGTWNTQDTITLIGWIVSTVGVHQVPNKPPAPVSTNPLYTPPADVEQGNA